MVALGVDEPVDNVLLSLRTTTARAGEQMRRWRIDGECEKIRGLGKIRNKTFVEQEIRENKDVHEKDKEEDNHPALGDIINATRRVLLRFEGAVEILAGIIIKERNISGVVLRGEVSGLVLTEGNMEESTYPEHNVR